MILNKSLTNQLFNPISLPTYLLRQILFLQQPPTQYRPIIRFCSTALLNCTQKKGHTQRGSSPNPSTHPKQNPKPDLNHLKMAAAAAAAASSSSSRYTFTKTLKELRFLFCQTSTQSLATRSFLTRAYPTMKRNNPDTPILIREASGTAPRVWARYELGREVVRNLDGLFSPPFFFFLFLRLFGLAIFVLFPYSPFMSLFLEWFVWSFWVFVLGIADSRDSSCFVCRA